MTAPSPDLVDGVVHANGISRGVSSCNIATLMLFSFGLGFHLGSKHMLSNSHVARGCTRPSTNKIAGMFELRRIKRRIKDLENQIIDMQARCKNSEVVALQSLEIPHWTSTTIGVTGRHFAQNDTYEVPPSLSNSSSPDYLDHGASFSMSTLARAPIRSMIEKMNGLEPPTTCVDTSMGLLKIIHTLGLLLPPGAESYMTCAGVYTVVVDPTSPQGATFWNLFPQLSGWDVTPENMCDLDLGVACRSSVASGKGSNATVCPQYDGMTVGSFACCQTCARVVSLTGHIAFAGAPSAAVSANASTTRCDDETSGLRDLVVALGVNIPVKMAEDLTCNIIGIVVTEPDSEYALIFKDLVAEYFGWEFPPSEACHYDLGVVCRDSADAGIVPDETSCLEWDGRTIASEVCCRTCADIAVDSPSTGATTLENVTSEKIASYSMGELALADFDVVSLVDFLIDLEFPLKEKACTLETICGCFAPFIRCPSSSQTGHVNLLLSNAGLGASLGAGERRRRLRDVSILDLSGNGIRGQLDAITEVLEGSVDRLQGLLVSNNSLSGPFPSQLKQFTNLNALHVQSNRLTGTIGADVLERLANLTWLDLSNNTFDGVIPTISSTSLRHFNASRNGFTSWMGIRSLNSTKGEWELDFDWNRFAVLPTSMKNMPNGIGVSIRHNLISNLPLWGNYKANAGSENMFKVLQKLQCEDASTMFFVATTTGGDCAWWDTPLNKHLEPPRWTNLKKLDLSGNPLRANLSEVMMLLAYAPLLEDFACENCNLTGDLGSSEYSTTIMKEEERCRCMKTFERLQYLRLAGNTGVKCPIVEVNRSRNPPFVCTDCLPYMEPPSGARMPLSKRSQCQCMGTMLNYDKEELAEKCGCDADFFMNEKLMKCEMCDTASENCAWGAVSSRSIRPPDIRSGYWASCQGVEARFAGHDVFKCYSKRTCLGWRDWHKLSDCSDDRQCAFGRTGRACSLCRPGYTGGRDDECAKCGDPETYRRNFVLGALASLPFFVICIRFFGGESRRNVAILLRRLRNVLKTAAKHLQLLAVLSNISIAWPAEVLSFLRILGVFELDVYMELGCAFASSSAKVTMICRWLMPLFIMLLATLASLSSNAFAYCFNAKSLQVNLHMYISFMYSCWTVFFNGLVKNTFTMVNCARSPNGKSMVIDWPHLECASEEWWRYFPGVAMSLFIYIFPLIVISYLTLRSAVREMSATNCKSRGAFAFTLDGLRDAKLHWNIYSMIQDLLLNCIIVAAPGGGTSELVGVATAISFYTYKVGQNMPYDTLATNYLVIGENLSSVFVLLLTGLNFDPNDLLDSGSRQDDDPHAPFLILIILLSSVLLPACILVYEVLCAVLPQKIKKRFPAWCWPVTDAVRIQTISAFTASVQDRLPVFLQSMDNVEFRIFCRAFFGHSSVHNAVSKGGVTKHAFAIPSLENPYLASVLRRMSNVAFVEQMMQNNSDPVLMTMSDALSEHRNSGIADESERFATALSNVVRVSLGSTSRDAQQAHGLQAAREDKSLEQAPAIEGEVAVIMGRQTSGASESRLQCRDFKLLL